MTQAQALVEKVKSGEGFTITGTEYTEIHHDGFSALFEDGSVLVTGHEGFADMPIGRNLWIVGRVEHSQPVENLRKRSTNDATTDGQRQGAEDHGRTQGLLSEVG